MIENIFVFLFIILVLFLLGFHFVYTGKGYLETKAVNWYKCLLNTDVLCSSQEPDKYSTEATHTFSVKLT